MLGNASFHQNNPLLEKKTSILNKNEGNPKRLQKAPGNLKNVVCFGDIRNLPAIQK